MIRIKIFPALFYFILCIVIGCILFGFTTVRKYQKNNPFFFKNNITLTAPDLNKDDKATVKSKLNTQLDDSAKVKIKDVAFIFHSIIKPPVFDTNAVIQSASNMRTAMAYLGYYHPNISYTFDTVFPFKEAGKNNYKLQCYSRSPHTCRHARLSFHEA